MLKEGQIGVHPPGSLGVAFLWHTRAECFIGRGGGGITRLLKEERSLFIEDNGTTHTLDLKGRIFANLLEAEAMHGVPELQMVCCNPAQLAPVTAHVTRFIEHLAEQGRLRTVDDIRSNVPILLMLPNGIIFEQMIQTFMDQIRESILLGRLAGFTDDMTDAVRDRVVRGVALQAGGRRGVGAQAVYVIERKGRIICAGGGEAERERIVSILAERDYPCENVLDATGARIEFDKAMISIVLNVGGLIHVVNADGSLNDLRMGDLCADPSKKEFIDRMTRAVFDIGCRCGAYSANDKYGRVWSDAKSIIETVAGHVTSSIKTFRDALEHDLIETAMSDLLTGARIDHRAVRHSLDFRTQLFEACNDLRVLRREIVLDLLVELPFLLVAHMQTSAEMFGADDDARFARRQFERIVLHVLTGPAKNRVE